MTDVKHRFFHGILLFVTVYLFFFLLKSPVSAARSVSYGISLCAKKAIPSLFPFLVLNEIMVSSGMVSGLGRLMGGLPSRLFKIKKESSSAFFSGCLLGFPLGTKTAVSLFENNIISKDEAERLTCFCSNTGPAFIIGIVGTALGNKKTALIIYISQILSAVLIGLFLRKKGDTQRNDSCQILHPFSFSLITRAISDSVFPMLNICAFICFFSCIALSVENIFAAMGINEFFTILFSGMLEITNGIGLIEHYGQSTITIALCAFFVGWSGLSVILQSIGISSQYGFKIKRFILSKLVQGILCTIICLILCKIFKLY